MLEFIIRFSIRNKLLIGLFSLALVVWGGYSVTQLPIDAVPDITNNQVQVITVAPSQSALDIERLVTFPVEQNIATIPGIVEVRSFSRFGLSVVTIVFEDNVDVYWARQQVNERLTEIQGQIPQGVGSPKLAPITTGLGEIYQYVIHPLPGYEDRFSTTELRTIQDWIVRRQLLGTPGVADVSSFGGYLKQYEIALHTDKLKSFGLSIQDVFTALENNNQNTGGAYIDKRPNAYFIRSEGLVNDLNDLKNILVKTTEGRAPVLLRDVANVQMGHAIRYGAMTRNADGEVTGAVVMMLKGANSSEVIKDVKERIEQIKKTLPEGVTIDAFLDRTKLVNKAIGTVTRNLAEGALIVIFVLVVLLGNLRGGLIVSSVIPLSMLFAIAMMNLFGVSGNLMSLGAIDFGLIVDGAVIIVEATMHHLGMRAAGKQLTQAEMDSEVLDSSRKIMSSAAFGEMIILIVYLPILALVGIEGKMFRPMAQTVAFAILGAFLLSLTYVPVITSIVLSKKVKSGEGISEKVMRAIHRVYDPVIRWSLAHIRIIILVALLLFASSMLLFSRLGAEFIPTLDEGDFAVETRILTGSSLSETIATSTQAADVLLKSFPDEVREVVAKIGSSEIPIDPMPIEACDLIVVLKEKSEWKKAKSRDELAEKMGDQLQLLPGVSFGFQQPIQMRFNELMTGARQDVVVKIYGEDLDQLTDYGQRMAKIVKTVKGARDLYVEKITGLPQFVVTIHRDRLAPYGLDVRTVNEAINMAFAGQSAGMVYENERRFDLVVRLDQSERTGIEDLTRLFVTNKAGAQIPLQQVADIEMKVGPNQIQRDDAKRRIVVGFNVRGRDVESMVKELQQKVAAGIRFAPGYYPTYGGAFKNLQEARARLYVAVPIALLLIFALLYFAFHSFQQSVLIYSAIPLSAIGGIIALWLRGMPFSISAGVGFIALFGVAVLNGIVLIAEFNHLKSEGETDLRSIIFKGTSTRLRPVIMTAAVASLGFLPMAISTSDGAEVQRPLATVVIGGLISATLLTLVVLPCLFLTLEKFQMKRRIKSGHVVPALLFLFSLIPQLASGQANSLKLEEAIQFALQNNTALRAARLEAESQVELKRTASEIPKTQALFTYGQYNSYNKDNNLTLTQSIPFPSLFGAQARLGDARIENGESRRAATENELIYQVKRTYLMLQYLTSRHRLLQRQDSIFRDMVRITTVQYNTGEGTLLQRTSAEARHNEVLNLLRQNTAELAVQENQMQILLNRQESVVLADPELIALNQTLSLDSAQTSTNPLLQYQQSLADIALYEKKVDHRRALPDLTVGFFNQTLIGFQRQPDGSESFYDGNYRFSGMMAGISIPLWFVPHQARIKSASLRAEAARNHATYFEKQLKGQWERAVQDFRKNSNSLAYYTQSALPNARLILQQSQIAFRAGEIGQSDYRLNLQQVVTIEEGYLQALLGYNESILLLEFLSASDLKK